MTTIQALKSIQDIEIIISPKDYDKEQKIIYISEENLKTLTNNWKMSFKDFINSQDFFDVYNTLTGLKIKEIVKFSCCLLLNSFYNEKELEKIKVSKFGKTFTESNGKYYN